MVRAPGAALARVCALLWLLCCACVSPAWAAVEGAPESGQQWVLQLGYFANLDNALNFKDLLTEAGFEVQVVSTGQPGEERYRVITGRADSAAELADLRETLMQRTGSESFPTKDPFQTERVREVFDQPQAKYLVAQAGADMPLDPSPMPGIGYDPGLSRTPQEEIDSMPGFTMAGMPIVPTIGP